MNDRNLTFLDDEEQNPIVLLIKKAFPNLTKSEARLARYILNNVSEIGLETGASLAAATQVSEITVSRFLRKLDLKGMRDLKNKLKSYTVLGGVASTERKIRLLNNSESALVEAESVAIMKLYAQISRPQWQKMIGQIASVDRVFVTGFQTVRGMSEDFARRLAIVRDAVRFVSAHEGGLAEWALPAQSIENAKNLLVMIDIVPYAREAQKICTIAEEAGLAITILTDESNNWAYSFTDMVFHAESKTGLFLESTATLTSMLNFIVHGVAERNPDTARVRIDNWQEFTRTLELY